MELSTNSVVQVAASVLIDYLADNQILAGITGQDVGVNLATSTVYHLIDEILAPLVVESIKTALGMIPLIGERARELFHKATSEAYLRVLLRMILIGVVQKAVGGQIDIIEGAILLASTYAVNFAVEIPIIQSVLEEYKWEIEF